FSWRGRRKLTPLVISAAASSAGAAHNGRRPRCMPTSPAAPRPRKVRRVVLIVALSVGKERDSVVYRIGRRAARSRRGPAGLQEPERLRPAGADRRPEGGHET